MASRLMRHNSRIIAYLPNLRTVVRHFRAFSSFDEREPKGATTYVEISPEDSGTVWPDQHLGPLGPQDARFPMPGLVGPAPTISPLMSTPMPPPLPDVLKEPLPHQRHAMILRQYLNAAQEDEAQYADDCQPSALDQLECAAQDCPVILRKDFQDLFPDRDLCDGPMTVISISQKTEHDMTGWSTEVEHEREELLHHFICGAEEICQVLHDAGYWADFIDPSSGRPYLGAYTNATLFETDERYRQFGFEIDDLGCCKVIRHHLWGTHAYVGCLFTSAPVDLVNKVLTNQILANQVEENE